MRQANLQNLRYSSKYSSVKSAISNLALKMRLLALRSKEHHAKESNYAGYQRNHRS
jgi:hypothetical protein